ncbi:MAG: enoyl-CoA hydratase/isomerase family protein [Phycicoccus sp.]|nr:enoyl-CoA hydratase/isomerase family protein [Phycicoccus sp.]
MDPVQVNADGIAAHRDDTCLVIAFARPERLNAFTPAMMWELVRLLQVGADDPAVRAVVLTAEGDRAFCAGGDMVDANPARPDEAYAADFTRVQRETTGRLYTYPKPLIGAFPGVIAGAGIGLALACPIRLGANGMRLVGAFARMEVTGDFGAPTLAARVLGQARAERLFLLDDRLDDIECLDRGVVHRLMPVEELRPQAVALAKQWGARSALAFRGIVDNLHDSADLPFAQALDHEVSRQLATSLSAEHAEAAHQFARQPTPKPDRGH